MRGGGRRAARGLRDRRHRQRDDDPARARDRPRAALDGAVHDRVARGCPRRRRPTSASRVHERAPAVLFPALGAYVGPDIVAGVLATGLTLDKRTRLFIDVGTNSEIVLGSSERALACAAPAGPGVRGGADPLRDARRRRRDRGREDRRRRGAADGDRRRRAARALRLRPRRRRRRARRRRHPRPLGPLRARLVGAAREDRRGERLPPHAGRLPLAARRARAAVREGVDRDRLGDPLQRPRRRPGGDLAGAARRLVRLVPHRGERGEDRARAAAAAAADRRRRQRRRRGREDRRAVGDRARRRERRPRRDRLRRAVRAAPTSTTCSSTSSQFPG